MFSKACHQILNNFDDVKIIDSTTISLPDNIKDHYKGMGGKNSVSVLKLQTVYSLSKNIVDTVDTTQGIQHDNDYAKNSKLPINKNEFLICDLGYYNTKFFNEIREVI